MFERLPDLLSPAIASLSESDVDAASSDDEDDGDDDDEEDDEDDDDGPVYVYARISLSFIRVLFPQMGSQARELRITATDSLQVIQCFR